MKSEVVVKTKFFVIKAADWLGQARTNETDNHHTSKRGTSHSFSRANYLLFVQRRPCQAGAANMQFS